MFPTAEDAGRVRVEIPVRGMSCAACASSVEKALERAPGASEAAVNLAAESATVLLDPAEGSVAELVGVVREAGYDVAEEGDLAVAAHVVNLAENELKAGNEPDHVALAQSYLDDRAWLQMLIERYGWVQPHSSVLDPAAWLLLKKLQQDCAAQHGPVQDIAISVPAYFDEIRRQMTMEAGIAAGLNVVGIVNEPVAAALYYATTCEMSGKVLVFDLGGGTFDVTIMDVNGHDMEIACSQGDHALGGIDFDQAILEIIEKAYKEEFGTDLLTRELDKTKYEDEAEDLKKTLSRRPVARKMIYGPAGPMRVEVTREMFEKSIASLVARTDMLVDLALDEVGIKPSDIDTVLLVGGSTRIPLIRQNLEKTFGFAPSTVVNVDECVALGAALHAGLTSLRERPDSVPAGIATGLSDINLTDVCNHSYGTICAPVDSRTGKRCIENRIILEKNTALPCEASQMFYTVCEGQTELEITVTQGEDTDPQYVNTIATRRLKLPPGRPSNCPVRVTYSYDVNQRMHCCFHDISSDTTLEVDLSLGRTGDVDAEPSKSTKQLQSLDVQ